MREAEVTVASPQRYWASTMPAHRASTSGRGSTLVMIQRKAPSPRAAASGRPGAARTTAASRIQPATPETITERAVGGGTFAAAPRVAGGGGPGGLKPGTVWGGGRAAREKREERRAVAGRAPPPAVPLKFSNRPSR